MGTMFWALTAPTMPHMVVLFLKGRVWRRMAAS
jgi:hypothetical protein